MNRLKHYQKYHLWYEAGMITLFFALNNTILATSIIMEAKRDGQALPFELWEPFLWEYSSAISTMMLLWPLFKFLEKKPFDWTKSLNSLAVYFIASIVFSLAHIAFMVLIRKVAYSSLGAEYDFGDLGYELLYEYRKDLWSFVFIVIVHHSYQFILSRLIGEANLIAEGEETTESESEQVLESDKISDRILVKKLGKEFIVKISDIEWLESSGNYVNLHVRGRIYPTRTTLSKLVEKISDKGFCRVHRSFAVNLEAINSITPLSSGDGEIILNNGKTLNLSRRYKESLKQRLH